MGINSVISIDPRQVYFINDDSGPDKNFLMELRMFAPQLVYLLIWVVFAEAR